MLRTEFRRFDTRSKVRTFGLALGLCLWSLCAFASSVREVDLGQMLRGSELVFEGRVQQVVARADPGGRWIRTYVTIAVTDVVKGQAPGSTVELSFLGGTVAGRTLRVGDLHLPEVGETGIYFVESPGRRQVHPLYGWSQGHFIVRRDAAGVERVLTERGAPVQALGAVTAPAAPALSTGVARGVQSRRGAALTRALSASTFKQRLRELLGKP